MFLGRDIIIGQQPRQSADKTHSVVGLYSSMCSLFSKSYREVINKYINSGRANVEMEEHKSRVIYLRNLADLMYTLDGFQNSYFFYALARFQKKVHLDTCCITGKFLSSKRVSKALTQCDANHLISDSPDLNILEL